MNRLVAFLVAGFICVSALAGEKRGGLVLQFDDGWSSWVTCIAPELARVGGKATGFVNSQYVNNSRITRDDLLTLQNTYHWEIGTHTWHHLNAPAFVRNNGIDRWMERELLKSLSELREAGLEVRSMVFPFNAYTRELARAVAPVVESFRRTETLALARGINPDKSVPATAIDMAHYVPPSLLKQWIDLAASQDQLLLLYGHRILPDDAFVTGTVAAVTATTLVADVPVVLPAGSDLVLVPDITRRQMPPDSFQVLSVTGKTVVVDRASLGEVTRPGATFMIGEAYSTRLSDFRDVVNYAADRVTFYSLHDVATGKHLTP